MNMTRAPRARSGRESLFAKKGEAIPAGVPVRDPRAGVEAGASSPLGFLIQRRVTGALPPGAIVAPPPVPIGETPWGADSTEEYPREALSAPPPLTPAAIDGGREEDWKRLSFRLRPESHRQLRNIARLWGVSVQSLLQNAVANFLDAALTPGDDWRH
ncbi:MAG: hypothetical protein WAS73_16215 [Defluviicoccus sp.]